MLSQGGSTYLVLTKHSDTQKAPQQMVTVVVFLSGVSSRLETAVPESTSMMDCLSSSTSNDLRRRENRKNAKASFLIFVKTRRWTKKPFVRPPTGYCMLFAFRSWTLTIRVGTIFPWDRKSLFPAPF